MRVYLLKQYENNNKGEMISVSKNTANDLIKNEIARKVENIDFLVKPKMGTTKTFGSSPNDTKVKSSIKGGRFLIN